MDQSKLWISQLVPELIYYTHIWKTYQPLPAEVRLYINNCKWSRTWCNWLYELPVHSICAAAGGTWSHINQSRVKQELTVFWRNMKCLQPVSWAQACTFALFAREPPSKAQWYNPLTLEAFILKNIWEWQNSDMNHFSYSVHIEMHDTGCTAVPAVSAKWQKNI